MNWPLSKANGTAVIVDNSQMNKQALWRLAFAMSVSDLDVRYRRTVLGRWWIALTFLLFVSIKVLIFGTLNNVSLHFFAPYLAIGYMLFRFMSQSITGGASVFLSSQSWIKTEPLPLSLYLFSFLLKNFMMMAYMALPTLVICVWAGRMTWLAIVCAPVVILVYAINHMWVSCLLGVVAARFRDVVYVLVTVMQVMYFATPVLWVPPDSGPRYWAVLINPLAHYIALLRDPVMYGAVPQLSWLIVGVVTCVGCIAAALVFARHKSRLVYWI